MFTILMSLKHIITYRPLDENTVLRRFSSMSINTNKAKQKKTAQVTILGKAVMCVALLGLFALASAGWLVSWVAEAEFGMNHSARVVSNMNESDCIIALGAQVKSWGEASPALLGRLRLTLEQYNINPRVIICCGGQGEDEPMAEGDFMRDWLVKQGVPSSMVFSENTSRNTKQNIEKAKQIMGGLGLETALVVTSDYHVARALAICKDNGIPAAGVGSESRPEMWWKNHIRESLSWIAYRLGK